MMALTLIGCCICDSQRATRRRLLNLPELLFGAFSHSHERNGTLAFRVRREEPDHVVIIKGQASSAQVLGVGREIQLASQNTGFELDRAVSTIPEALQNRSQVYQEKYVHGAVRGQLLVQSEVTGLGGESFPASETQACRDHDRRHR